MATLVVIAGDVALKVAVERGHTLSSPLVAAGFGLYGLSAIGWFLALQRMTLSQTGVAFSVFSLLALVGIGVFQFGERLEAREILGVSMAVCSILLMARFV
ncbi:hypothetical protein [Paenirhodobacter sp.]|uniref:hypothetical protein n=1 Tax=Paenirhodobacter sp. TaxID=1965326 RepID=UPI003B3C50C9